MEFKLSKESSRWFLISSLIVDLPLLLMGSDEVEGAGAMIYLVPFLAGLPWILVFDGIGLWSERLGYGNLFEEASIAFAISVALSININIYLFLKLKDHLTK